MDKGDKKLLQDIKTYGWHVLKVFAVDGKHPDFAYSIGAYHSFRQPEIILFGLDLNDMHKIINDIVGAMKEGIVITPETPYSEYLDGYDCVFRSVKKEYYDEYFGYGQWFYKSQEFPALQCCWPDNRGCYPWQPEFAEGLVALQPLLFDDGNV